MRKPLTVATTAGALFFAANYPPATADPTTTAPAPGCRTVDQAFAENQTDWLKRVEKVGGLGGLCLVYVNDTAWTMCGEMWDGADYDKMINRLSATDRSVTRAQILAIYSVAMGSTCNQAPGAPLGMPKT